MHVIRCRIADQFRRRRSQNVPLGSSSSDSTTEPVIDIPDASNDALATIWDEEWRKNIVDVAMQRVRGRVNPELYQIFYLHAVKGLGVRDVARLTSSSLPKVYVTYHRIAKQVKEEVRRLENNPAYG
jgi:DNA-directed RNA polymerase specialized sigma24 family protein